MTGHDEFLAELDAMKAAAAVATEKWHGRLGELRDALAGVALADTDDQLLKWLARTEEATGHALDLFERIKRGAYPALDADRADARARRERERDRVPASTHITDPVEEV
jgi:hypothetical protein